MIHYFTPYSTEKNFGKAINESCALVPEGDWICIMDGDILFLTPEWGKLISDVVERHGKHFSLFGCMTNRLAQPTQRHNGEFSNNHDIRHHREIATQRQSERYSEVSDITSKRCVAGMFMLFPKKLWKQIKFKEKTMRFDVEFSRAVAAKGHRIGLMEGLYVYHMYRLWSDDPARETKHLHI